MKNSLIAYSAPDGFISERLAIGSALFILYFVHYFFLSLDYQSKLDEAPFKLL